MPELTPESQTATSVELPPEIARELDVFEIELGRFLAGQIPVNVFTEFRLRHGVYGQRQDDVQMIRIKIPAGTVTPEQLETLGELAEEYGHGISHITTRQDIQYHFVRLKDTPSLLRRLAAVGLTTKEACGNVVRNVTDCPKSGVCQTEVFDTTPYAIATAYFLLRHPELQNFGRKFKIAFSGCEGEMCGLARMHDIGAIAAVREVNGKTKRGFRFLVGGGLGAVPHQAKVFEEFLPEEELLPMAVAIGRVFTQRGERKSRMKARIKFLVEKLGIEEFKRLVYEERTKMETDPRWTEYLTHLSDYDETPLKPPSSLNGVARPEGFDRWARTNVLLQKQEGYASVIVTVPLGDLTHDHCVGLAAMARKYVNGTARFTVSQNVLFRWVCQGDLIDFYNDLKALKLADSGAEGIADVVACPGSSSCKLGITQSKGLAKQLREGLSGAEYDEFSKMSIKISGCPNSCGQHHIADIGFFGSSKRAGTHVVPHFQVVLGGQRQGNAASYGLAVGKVPTKNAPDFVKRLLALYKENRTESESFPQYVQRLGKERVKEILSEYDKIPDYTEKPDFYVDWDEDHDFFLMTGTGECAGELVELVEFMLTEADRHLYEASLHWEKENFAGTAQLAVQAMVRSADALLTTVGFAPQNPLTTVENFNKHFVENGKFFNAYSEFISKWMDEDPDDLDDEDARFCLEEATLFVTEAHNVYGRMSIKEAAARPSETTEEDDRPMREGGAPTAVEEIVDSLDLRGVECPYNYVRTKVRLETMTSGQLLEITIDEGQPIRQVPASLKKDGHTLVDTKKVGQHFRLVIRKG